MDRRDRSFEGLPFNPDNNTVRVAMSDPDGEEVEVDFPAKFEVCGTCQGRGSHVNPNIDRNGISSEDFDADPDFRESYMSGAYDQTCNECKGLRVVPAIDREALDAEQQADLAIWEQQQADRYADEEADERTYRMESGIWD
jgi:hypothetical protein